ncbi:PRC-barrel domain-containing protein [Virgibacillus salarius]|uniref:PRC-barrel domain-containing protein n=1 Tax=Virgibacillus salarius TaxID=447199 RepID=UPI00248F4D8F|nr:PRC-barrel domain-containing protein [Virgibacillus salarius]WBX80092.1 PRC-barrel domain-containing protein [Virgibacillus salarius]
MFLTSELKNYKIHASDGVMGKVKDLYFDDNKWAIRYAVVDTRKWLLRQTCAYVTSVLSSSK